MADQIYLQIWDKNDGGFENDVVFGTIPLKISKLATEKSYS